MNLENFKRDLIKYSGYYFKTKTGVSFKLTYNNAGTFKVFPIDGKHRNNSCTMSNLERLIDALNAGTVSYDDLSDRKLKSVGITASYPYIRALFSDESIYISRDENFKEIDEVRFGASTEDAVPTRLSADEWLQIFQNPEISTEEDLSFLKSFLKFRDNQINAGKLGEYLGYTGKNTSSPLNSRVSRWAKKIEKSCDARYAIRNDGSTRYWSFFFFGWSEKKLENGRRRTVFIWRPKPEIISALRDMSVENDPYHSHSNIDETKRPNQINSKFYSEEELSAANVRKPEKSTADTGDSYKRDERLKDTVLKNNSFTCCFDSSHRTFLSAEGNNFVEGHHVIPMRQQCNYKENLDRSENLVSLCPNCHRAVHFGNKEIKEKIVTKLFNRQESFLKKAGLNASMQEIKSFYGI